MIEPREGVKRQIWMATRCLRGYPLLGLPQPDCRKNWLWELVPGPVAFDARADLLDAIETTERNYDWEVRCADGVEAHRRILLAGDWLIDHAHLAVVRATELATACGELQKRGVALFHPWRVVYEVAAVARNDGQSSAQIVRTQERDRAATTEILGATTRRISLRRWPAKLRRDPVRQFVGEIILTPPGDTDAATVRRETLRREVAALNRLASVRYQQAVQGLDGILRDEATDRDQARRTWLLSRFHGETGTRASLPRPPISVAADGVRLIPVPRQPGGLAAIGVGLALLVLFINPTGRLSLDVVASSAVALASMAVEGVPALANHARVNSSRQLSRSAAEDRAAVLPSRVSEH